MGAGDDVGAVQNLVVDVGRLVPEHVQAGARDAAALQRLAQVRLVDNLAPAAVDQECRGLHGVQLRLGDGVVGDALDQRHLHDDHVGGL